MSGPPGRSTRRLNGPPYAYRWVCEVCGTPISTAAESPQAADRAARRQHTSARCAQVLQEQERHAQEATEPRAEPVEPAEPPPEADAADDAMDEQRAEGQPGLFD
ncbi:MAG: hypothetical protein F4187_04080 [Gemmatimonadetes bacterium]|nr:hypothetical protein [Gemmatimonadota bacterium]